MKINGIKSTEYRVENGTLHIWFEGTTYKKLLGLDTSTLTITTDSGDTVETLTGWTVKSGISRDLINCGVFTLSLIPADPLESAFTTEELETMIADTARAAISEEVQI